MAAGVVTWAGKRTGYGNLVEINHGDGYVTRYAHNEKTLVSVGQTVKRGDPIALMGSTGPLDGSARALRGRAQRPAGQPAELHRHRSRSPEPRPAWLLRWQPQLNLGGRAILGRPQAIRLSRSSSTALCDLAPSATHLPRD